MSEALDKLKEHIGSETLSKITSLLKDADGTSPTAITSGLAAKARKLSSAKSVTSTGITGFKGNMGLPSGRIDAAGSNPLTAIKQQAATLVASATAAQSAVSDFAAQYPELAESDDVKALLSTISSVSSGLSAVSAIDTDKLEGEISAATAAASNAEAVTAKASSLREKLGV